MPGLVSLRALHTIAFRTEDTCLWVMREFRKFTLDNLAHNPDMKLEWLALANNVEALVRRVRPASRSGGVRRGENMVRAGSVAAAVDKGKGKAADHESQSIADAVAPFKESLSAAAAAASASASGVSTPSLSVPTATTRKFMDSSDDEDEYYRGKAGLKIESIEGIQFQDVPGVRIFEKDIICGRL